MDTTASLSSPRAAELDPVWPPPPEDLAACRVVRFAADTDGVERAETLTVADFPPPLPPIQRLEPSSPLVRLPVVHREPPPERTTPGIPIPPPEPTYGDNARMAWLAVLFAVACAAVGYSEFQAGVGPLGPVAGEPVVAAASSDPEPAQDASGPWPDPLVSLYETRADAARPVRLKFLVIDPRRAAARAKPAKPKAVGTVAEAAPSSRPTAVVATSPLSERNQPPRLWPSRPATVPPPTPQVSPPRFAASSTPGPATPAPAPAPAAVERRASSSPVSPSPVSSPAVSSPAVASPAVASPAASAHLDPLPGEEDHIRSTLTRFGTAYSRLDARAARAVWPSVDVRALERAFDGLKSQELRFDGCSFTVDGARARAACTGRAVYVPRIGNQSPRSTSRQWTFDLMKADQGWTIASARSS